MTNEQQTFLNAYLDTLTEAEKNAIPQVSAEQFCADEYNTNECARLINIGQKTASCGLQSAWDSVGDPLPERGNLCVVLDWNNNPVCIAKITSVELCPFNNVPEEFAIAEGEGDGTYEWWHKAHVEFFTQYARDHNLEFKDDSMLVLERFEKVYPLEQTH